jgi:hypothetical protein
MESRAGVVVQAWPFVCRHLTSPAVPRPHFPPTEPDVPVSRIRLSAAGVSLRRG